VQYGCKSGSHEYRRSRTTTVIRGRRRRKTVVAAAAAAQQQPQLLLTATTEQAAPQQPAPRAPAAARVVKPTPLAWPAVHQRQGWGRVESSCKVAHETAFGINPSQDVELLVLSLDDDTSRHVGTCALTPSTLPSFLGMTSTDAIAS
jgi:hypothetical protein